MIDQVIGPMYITRLRVNNSICSNLTINFGLKTVTEPSFSVMTQKRIKWLL